MNIILIVFQVKVIKPGPILVDSVHKRRNFINKPKERGH